MNSLRIAVFLLMISACPSALCFRDDDSDSDLSGKVSTLEDQVKVLTNEVKRLKGDFNDYKGETGVPQPIPSVMPIRATRLILGGGMAQFTLTYRTSAAVRPEVKAFWMRMDTYTALREHIANRIPVLAPTADEYSTSVIVPASNVTHLSVSLGITGEWFRIYIQNSVDAGMTQEITSLPILDIEPAGDLVYEPGRNLTLKITVPLNQRSSDPGSYIPENLDGSFYINIIGTNEILSKFGNSRMPEGFINLDEEKTFFDHRELTSHLNTSARMYSGFLEFMGGQSYPGSLVSRIERSTARILRPSTQRGAFSDGFMTARTDDSTEVDEAGNLVEKCRPNVDCRVFCQFLGNNLRPVELLRTDGDGQARSIFPLARETSPYSASVMQTFRMSENQGVINYTCVGSNDMGRRIAVTHLVHFSNPPQFVQDQTKLELLPDQNVSVTCTAVGRPFPRMTISLNAAGDETFFSGDDLDIVYQTNDTISVSKVTPLRSLSNSDMGTYLSYISVIATCYANNTYGSSTEFRDMYPSSAW